MLTVEKDLTNVHLRRRYKLVLGTLGRSLGHEERFQRGGISSKKKHSTDGGAFSLRFMILPSRKGGKYKKASWGRGVSQS